MKIDKKTVCVVALGAKMGFDSDGEQLWVQDSPILYQVTIDPAYVSPSGEYIRLGMNPGDEVMGWQPLGRIILVEVLAEWTEGKPPEIHTGSEGVEINEAA